MGSNSSPLGSGLALTHRKPKNEQKWSNFRNQVRSNPVASSCSIGIFHLWTGHLQKVPWANSPSQKTAIMHIHSSQQRGHAERLWPGVSAEQSLQVWELDMGVKTSPAASARQLLLLSWNPRFQRTEQAIPVMPCLRSTESICAYDKMTF